MPYGNFGPIKGLQIYSAQDLAESHGTWTGIRTNHVVDTAGSFVDEFGSSRGLSNEFDLALLIALRRRADLVLVDARTARQESYRALSKTALGLISQTGDFSGIPAAESKSSNVYLFSGNGTDDIDNRAVQIGNGNPFPAILAFAKSKGWKAILLEAGPTLARLAFDAKLVSQSAITITSKVALPESFEPTNPFDAKAKLLSLAVDNFSAYSLWTHDGVADGWVAEPLLR